MDAIMTSGPISGLAEPHSAPRLALVGTKASSGLRQARAMVGAARAMVRVANELVCRFFDWQWERVRRAEERDLVARMGARERSDIGLPPRGGHFESSGFWRH
jgi:hypothetical protein